jgi:hypothetical protein
MRFLMVLMEKTLLMDIVKFEFLMNYSSLKRNPPI